VLIYVPSVNLAEQVGRALQQHFAQQELVEWVEFIHAGDGQRDVKRARFFAGEFPILVTTTLLERGITLSRVNLIVLYADSSLIFSEPVLTQIAGRAGRTAEYPSGRVHFLAEKRSREMVSARKRIQSLNRAARQVAAAALKEEKQHVEN
jgi:competence protein ComFA